MMKKIIAILCTMFSIFVQASEWSSEFEIREINAGYKGGYIVLMSKSPVYNPDGCTNGAYAIHPDDANVEHSLSLLLSAEARNKKIKVAVNGCTTKVNNYPKVTRIKLTNY